MEFETRSSFCEPLYIFRMIPVKKKIGSWNTCKLLVFVVPTDRASFASQTKSLNIYMNLCQRDTEQAFVIT
jgi:hypothetical protein